MRERVSTGPPPRVGYILKRYPRLSETFIVNEILSIEAAGADVAIFAAGRPAGEPVHPAVSRVAASVTYTRKEARLAPHDLAGLARTCGAAARFESLLAEARVDGPDAVDEVIQAGCIARHLTHHPVDHLHAHFATSAARIARHVSALTGVGFSFTAHAKDIFVSAVEWPVVSRLLREALFPVAISDYHARFLVEKEPSTRPVVVRNGIDLHQFRFDFSVNPAPLVLGVGRLVEKKGFVFLVEAAAHLRDRGVGCETLLVGEGPEREKIENAIRRLDLADRVRLAGAQDQDFVRRALARAAVVAVPCIEASNGDRDGLPTVLIEAMASGVAVVSTPVTAIPELVIDGRTGRLVAPGDVPALADAVSALLHDAPRRARLACAARTRVEDLHDSRENGRQLLAAFSQSFACV
ncbi:MAG: glycosyltransferase [Acidobacteriota bacterium]